jgi:protein tyrosine phosphatase (PTP) superfamily phosphohydrolase (DUF442 family)
MKSKPFLLLAILWLLIFALPSGETAEPDPATRQWAAAVNVSEPDRLYKVSDELYRGARVSHAGAEQLRSLGINTVVSLRYVRRDSRYIEAAGLNYVQIRFKSWQPDEDEVVEFLRIVARDDCRPVYVYCNRGAERTGMMCAAYRIVVQGWSKAEAVREMTEGPFDYLPIFKKVVQFVWDMDVDRIKQRAGLADR